jgi:biotin carboxylase
MQIPLITEAQRRGFQVLVTDRDLTAPGARLAEMAVRISTHDVDAHLALASELRDPPAAVLTAGADVGPTVSALSEHFGQVSIGMEAAIRARDKARMRVATYLPHPHWATFTGLPEASKVQRFWENSCLKRGLEPYPAIVKPADNSATRGHSVVRSEGTLYAACEKALSHNILSKSFVIEEQLYGPEAAFDFFVEAGRAVFANGAWRLFRRRSGHGLEAGHINPFPAGQEVMDLAQLAVERLGIGWGPFKIDVMYDDRYGPCILECATRLSGGFDHMYSSPLATGKDVTGAMLDVALGQPLDRSKLIPRWDRYACVLAPTFAPGPIAGWDLPIPGRLDGLERIFVTRTDWIPPLESCADRTIFVMASGDSAWGALKAALRACASIKLRR